MKAKLAIALGAVLALASCAPTLSTPNKLDGDLSCDEIKTEYVKTQKVKSEAEGNKGLSGQNVAWALLFWPGIILNEANNNDVIRRSDERMATLNQLYTAKKCGVIQDAPAEPTATSEK